MSWIRRSLLLAGLLASPAAVLGQPTPSAPGAAGQSGVQTAQMMAPAAPVVADSCPGACDGAGAAPAGGDQGGFFSGRTVEGLDYPDFALFPNRPMRYRWDGRLRWDFDYMFVNPTFPNGTAGDTIDGFRIKSLYWVDVDQRWGLQTSVWGAGQNLDDLTDIPDIASDVLAGRQSILASLNGRNDLRPLGILSGELLWRLNLWGRRQPKGDDCGCEEPRRSRGRLDLLLGPRGLGYGSGFLTPDQAQFTLPPGLPAAVSNAIAQAAANLVNFEDRAAGSIFVGGEWGLGAEYALGRLLLEADYKMGIGSTFGYFRRDDVRVNGNTLTLTSSDIKRNQSAILNEVDVGAMLAVTRHLNLRVGYLYTHVNKMLFADPAPNFRSLQIHSLTVGVVGRF